MTEGATQAVTAGRLPAVTYRLELKSADWPAPAPDAEAPVTDPAVEGGVAHQWAGDLYQEGDESDPADAFAVLSGEAAEESWLDRADDGTLTGWVKDSDGQVYRYSDVDAWAIDVDAAQMVRVDTAFSEDGDADPDELEDDELEDDELEDDEADDGEVDPDADPAEGDDEAPDAVEDPFATTVGPEPTDDPADGTASDGAREPGDGTDTDPAEDPSKVDFLTKMRKGREGKSHAMRVTERR